MTNLETTSPIKKLERGFLQRNFTAFLLILLFLTFFLALIIGRPGFSIPEILQSLTHLEETPARLILYEIRIPRLILTLAIGFISGFLGAVLQGYFRNPLADPAILGLSSGAILGAVFAFYFSASGLAFLGIHASFTLTLISIPLLALTGTAITAFALLTLTYRVKTPSLLILAGIALGGLTTALTALLLSLSPNPWALSEMINWLMGSTDKAGWQDVILALPFMGTGLLLLLPALPALNSLSLGEETAQSLGVNLVKTQNLIIIGTAFAIGGCVATTGQIGFIGLIAPHLVRPVIKAQPVKIIFPSACLGGLLLLLSDLVIHLFPTGRPLLPLGVVTALMGTPFFFFLIFKLKQNLQ